MPKISVDDIEIDVTFKKIKNLHLRVCPPKGKVYASAPLKTRLETVYAFASAKIGWIRSHQARLIKQAEQNQHEFISFERHRFLGMEYLLMVSETTACSGVTLNGNTIELAVCPGTPVSEREAMFDNWYREQLMDIVFPMVSGWEKIMNVKVKALKIRKMKTRWGSCNPGAGRVWLNSELARMPVECIEYVLVHEMVHLLELKHGKKFIYYIDKFLPEWKTCKQKLKKAHL